MSGDAASPACAAAFSPYSITLPTLFSLTSPVGRRGRQSYGGAGAWKTEGEFTGLERRRACDGDPPWELKEQRC